MKQLVLVAMLLLAINAEAQHYRKFLFSFDIGYPTSSLNSGGLFAMEPAYRLNDKILIGFRSEVIGFISMAGSSNSSLASMGLNGQYYFNSTSSRPFCGLGIGLYNPSDNFIMSNTDSRNQRNGFGVYPRVGLDFGHGRLMLEYNFIQEMNNYISPGTYAAIQGAQGYYEMVNPSYLSLKIGFFIGGGKKK